MSAGLLSFLLLLVVPLVWLALAYNRLVSLRNALRSVKAVGAREVEQVREARTVRRATAVADVQRAGGVRRHELDLEFLAIRGTGPTELRAEPQRLLDRGVLCLRR